MGGNTVDDQMILLKELQGLDQKLNTIGQDQLKLETERQGIDTEVVRIRDMVASLEGSIAELEGQRAQLRLALDQEQANVEKSEGRLPEIKTQKEYLAVLKEIDTAKKLNKDLTDQVEAKNAEIAALNEEKTEKQQNLTEMEEQIAARCGEIEGALKSLEKSRQSLAKQRDSQIKPLPKNLQRSYKLLMERRAGVAVVEARNGACLGCNMHLPPQLFNSLFLAQEIKTCPHCSRMLFVVKED
jgi:predicted  nucleic acid-binding Zn-ribbon protein